MYSLRFDHGVTSAGFALSPRGLARLTGSAHDAHEMWCALVRRYPTIAALFGDARPVTPIAFRERIQHRLTRAAGDRWLLLPHAYGFVDPLFSTGIAWALRAVERVALAFEPDAHGRRRRAPRAGDVARYEELLSAEADQIDRLVAGAYDAMAHFDLFAAHALIYFAIVSFNEVRQRVRPSDSVAWDGFLGVGDAVVERLPRESRRRLRRITGGAARVGTSDERARYVQWATDAIAPRNIGGFGDPARRNLYPVDLDLLVSRHELLGMSRGRLVAALPLLRGAQ
jgi:FADH2 O2-dependent halogenase